MSDQRTKPHTTAGHGMTGSRGLQPLVCSMCGSVWFRLATFARSDEAHLQPPRLAMPDVQWVEYPRSVRGLV